jgi:hypothetical protein
MMTRRIKSQSSPDRPLPFDGPQAGNGQVPPADNNGRADSDQDRHAAELLKQAINAPGVKEIPPAPIQVSPKPVLEIPARDLSVDGQEGGQPLPVDPTTLVALVSRPSPHGPVRLFPDRALRAALLAYQPNRNRSPDYYYVIPELEAPMRKHLKQVRVDLVFDLVGNECFLWITPESDMSPYHNALMRVLSRPPEFIATHKFLFGKADLKTKSCDLQVKPLAPDDPVPLLPSRSVGVLLAEALGTERTISTTGHPVFLALAPGGTLL